MPGFCRPGHVFLPPYSRNLNVIEIPFSFVKSDTIVVAMDDVIPVFDAGELGLKTADIENSISYIVNHFL